MNLASQYIFSLKNCHKNIHYYLASITLFGLSQGIYLVLFNLYLQDLGFREDFVGRAVALQSLAGVLVLVPAGILSDRLGRKTMMLLGSLGKGLFIFSIALTSRGPLLLLWAFGIGLSQALLMVTSAPYLAENTQQKDRMHLFSISWFFIMFSAMGGNFIGGWMSQTLETYFSFSPIYSKRAAFFVAFLLSLLVFLPLRKIQEKSIPKGPKGGHFFVQFFESTDKTLIFKFTLASLFLGLGAGLFVPYFNLYFTNRFQLSTGYVGTIMAFGQAFMALAMLFGPPLAQHVGRVASICLFQLSSVLFLLILAQTQLLTLAIVSFLFRGALMNAANPLTTNLMMDYISPGMKGTANSLHQLVFQLGWVICGPISGYLIASYTYSLVFYLAAFLYLVSSIYFWFTFRPFNGGDRAVQS